jgi:hypothetical protein
MQNQPLKIKDEMKVIQEKVRIKGLEFLLSIRSQSLRPDQANPTDSPNSSLPDSGAFV